MKLSKMNPELISQTYSPRHIQSIIEDLLQVIKRQDKLVHEVLNLNPLSCTIGAGRLANLQELAKDVVWK